jgi:hypothetical protein
VRDLRELYGQLKVLAPEAYADNNPFFNCWFLSVPQLLTLIEGVQSGEELKDALWRIWSSTFGALDFYFELAQWKRIRAGAAAESAKQ